MQSNEEYMKKISEYVKELKNKNVGKDEVSLIKNIIKDSSCGILKTNYETWLEECISNYNWSELNNLIFQECHFRLLPGCSGGTDHSANILIVLEAFACGDDSTFERVFHLELGGTKNGYPFLVVISNLLIALWYQDEGLQQKAILAAEKFVSTKKPQWERAAVAFVMDIHKCNVQGMTMHLQQVCAGYARTDFEVSRKRLCVPAHGLYCLAKKLLSNEVFLQIEMPNHKSFSKKYAEWRNQNPIIEFKLYFKFPNSMDIINKIYAYPVAKSIITQPYINSNNPYHSAQLKKRWFLDEDAMLETMSNEIAKHCVKKSVFLT